MQEMLTIEDFYRMKLASVPENLSKEIGHFNVFKLEDFTGAKARPIPYSRKEFFKIGLIIGNGKVHYADKTIAIDKQGLLFTNPQVPYDWDAGGDTQSGFFCVFTEAFFRQYGNLKDYPVFKTGGTPLFMLTNEQVAAISAIFQRMFAELESSYTYKYDVLRNLVMELMHSAMKLEPANFTAAHYSNAGNRISSLFLELLERQFPIENPGQRFQLRSATDYARQLSVHVNHLNRALKETTQKTTSEIISSRLVQEAKVLLRHTDWNVSEIAYSLGFEEPAHFNNFFKKNLQLTPSQFRTV